MGGDDLAAVTDAELLARLRREPAALEEFYRRHIRALTRFALHHVGEPHTAEDVVAATFLAVIDGADRYDSTRAASRAWLFGIAAHLIATHHRRAAAEQRATRRLSGQRVITTDDVSGLEDAIDAGRRTGPTNHVLAKLPAAERELVSLLLDHLTLPEAADALGIRPGTARMRLSRARARLAPELNVPKLNERDGGVR